MKRHKLFLGLMLIPCLCFSIISAPFAATAVPKQQNNLGNLYGIGSVSKVFTAAAVMKLQEMGLIDIDEPLITYMPDFYMDDQRYKDITTRMLLNHSSGFTGMTDNNAMLIGDNATFAHDNLLSRLKTQKLKHDPGALSVYSNDSFTVAEILVERVSGVSFTEFLDENFFNPLGLDHIKSPQSDLDIEKIAPVYYKKNQTKPETLNLIGSGGLYASMEDLCRYATLFMDDASGEILSKASVKEMASDQHKSRIVPKDSDSVYNYGLGWDSVQTYPFNTYGIQALSKGGGTSMYTTNLTVIPEYSLAVAVSSSGGSSMEQLIAQEIILEVLREEGIIDDSELALPVYDEPSQPISADIKQYAGLYDMGFITSAIEINNDTLSLTRLGTDKKRSINFRHIGNGEFVSTGGDYLGLFNIASTEGGTRGSSKINFIKDGERIYLCSSTYVNNIGLGQTAYSMPFGVKLEPNPISQEVKQAWNSRTNRNYLLVSEKYSSTSYLEKQVARLSLDDQVEGYVMMGEYKGSGVLFKSAKIVSDSTALGYQSTPTMYGRDTNDLVFTTQDGVDLLQLNGYRYINEEAIQSTSQIKDTVQTIKGTRWYKVDDTMSGEVLSISHNENASYFVYDDKLNCIASSLELKERLLITLPENGYIAFVGENAEFLVGTVE